MTVGEIKKQLAQFDDNTEILYNEPIIGALIPMINWNLKKILMIQTKDGDWFSENEFEELKKNNEKFDSDILIKKEKAYLYYDRSDEYECEFIENDIGI